MKLGRRLKRRLLLGLLTLVIIALLPVVLFGFLPVPASSVMVQYAVGGWFHKRPPIEHQWVGWDHISKNAALAVMASEDQRFPEHHGFDFEAIQKAMAHNEEGGHLRGASTISQQVAKNLFLWQGRSWLRKGLEAGYTVLIEALWTKRRILTVYLNIAEFGEGIYGVQAASRHFFHKDAANLSRREAALLAAVLPSPRRYHVDRPSAYIYGRVGWIERQMSQLGNDYVP